MRLESSENYEFQSSGIRWLLADLEVVNNPNVLNTLILNIYKISKHIKDVEIVADYMNKKMLIYIELSKWGAFWHTKSIGEDTLNMLRDVLPNYQMRVVFDRKILDMAKKVAESL